MPRTDPTETGGLFIGRRPGTAPLRYKDVPQRGQNRRQRIDATLANLVLGLEILLVCTAWGPQPVGWLWIASQVSYWVDSLFVGIIVAFVGLLGTVMATLWLAVQMDGGWRILRRAAGFDQKEGALGRIFMWTAVIFGSAFLFWLFVIEGPGSTIMPGTS